MQCPSCGHINPVDTSFCGKCVAPLNRLKIKLVDSRRVFIPPQEEYIVRPHSIKRPSSPSYSWGWLVLLVLAIAVLAAVFLYE